MSLLDKLRNATKPLHEELDAAMVPFIKSIRSVDDYCRLLSAFYGFFKPVYEKIDLHIQVSYLPDYSTRRKPDDIVRNLFYLSHYTSPVNIAQQLPAITNNTSAFGALYVMEGSTLGGLMIKRMLAEQTGLSDEQLSFFAGYGKDTRAKWNIFTEALNIVAHTDDEEQIAIYAASQTFGCFKDWLNQYW